MRVWKSHLVGDPRAPLHSSAAALGCGIRDQISRKMYSANGGFLLGNRFPTMRSHAIGHHQQNGMFYSDPIFHNCPRVKVFHCISNMSGGFLRVLTRGCAPRAAILPRGCGGGNGRGVPTGLPNSLPEYSTRRISHQNVSRHHHWWLELFCLRCHGRKSIFI